MPLIIPNAGDTTGGNKYESLDQAEPDALDFETLGYLGSGVVSGCLVTTNNSNATVAVSAGVVVLGGVPYAVSANSGLSIPASPADNRFDIVVARVSAGVASLVVVQGTNSSTNPTYPKSASVLTGAPSPTTNVDFSTDVVLAALYRSGSNAVTTSRIVDKRVMQTFSIGNQGSAIPTTLIGTGALYLKTGDPTGPASGVYVQTSTGAWIELAQNVGSHLPIGAAVAWPSKQTVPVGCVELNGQALAVSAYPAAFAAWGYDHCGAGATFNAPNWNNKYLRGTTSTGTVATNVGADSITLAEAQLPAHVHTLANHTHTLSHEHVISHTHSSTSTDSASPSAMSGSSDQQQPPVRVGIDPGFIGAYDLFYDFAQIVLNGGWPTSGPAGVLYGDEGSVPGISRLPHLGTRPDLWNPGRRWPFQYAHSHSVTVNAGGSHSHGIPAIGFSGNSTGQTNSTTSQATGNTGNVGSGTAVDVRPASTHTRWIARVSLGTDTTTIGAKARVFSYSSDVENPTVAETYLWVAAFDCVIQTVRAMRLDGTTLTLNIRVNDATNALASDLNLVNAGTWYSATSANVPVLAGQLVEVKVQTVSGSPTLAHVQVDFAQY